MDRINRFFYSLFFIASFNLGYSSQKMVDIYIYDTPTKIYGKAYVNFLTVENKVIKKIDRFIIFYNKKNIKKVEHSVMYVSENVESFKNGNITYNSNMAYGNVSFKSNKIFSNNFYELLDKHFLEMSCSEKLECLLELSQENY